MEQDKKDIPPRMFLSCQELKQEILDVLEDVKYRGNSPHRRYVFLESPRREKCVEFLKWILTKYDRMLNSKKVQIGMLVGTLNKQSAKLESQLNQISMFESEKELDSLRQEKIWINAFIEICYKGKDYFENIYHAG